MSTDVYNLMIRGMRREETGLLCIFWEGNRRVAKMWLRKWEGEKIHQLEEPKMADLWFMEGKWNKGMSRNWLKLAELWLVGYNDIIECNGIVENTWERGWIVADEIQWKLWKIIEEKRGLDKRKYSKGACRNNGWIVIGLLCVTGVCLCCDCWILIWGLSTWCIPVTPLSLGHLCFWPCS
jgi:hypothetical protein